MNARTWWITQGLFARRMHLSDCVRMQEDTGRQF